MVGKDAPYNGYTRAPEPGFSASIGYVHSFKHIQSIIELSYLQKGVRYMDTEQSGIIVNLDYIELPLSIHYSIGNKDIVFNPGLGIAPGYLVRQESFEYFSDHKEPVETYQLRSFDLSLFTDIEFSKRLPKGSLSLSIRPSISLITNDPAGSRKDHSFTGLFSLVYKLPIAFK